MYDCMIIYIIIYIHDCIYYDIYDIDIRDYHTYSYIFHPGDPHSPGVTNFLGKGFSNRCQLSRPSLGGEGNMSHVI